MAITHRPRVLLLKNQTADIDQYKTVLEDDGFEPVFVPLITHRHVPEELLSLLQDTQYFQNLKYLIITSQRTVECLSHTVIPNLTEEQRNLLLSKTVFTVGPATSHLLEHVGFCSIKGGPDAGNGAVLADIILRELSSSMDNSSQILFLAGEIRRDIIPKKLSANGIEIKEIVVYKTQEMENNVERFINLHLPDSWVVLFSPQGTSEIVEYLKNHNTGTKIASIGPTTEQYLLSNGLHADVVSTKPDAPSLSNAIRNYSI